jgi:hypothetical protein
LATILHYCLSVSDSVRQGVRADAATMQPCDLDSL